MLELILSHKLYLYILVLPFFSHMLYDFFQKGMVFELWGNFIFKEDYHNDSINDKQDALRKQIENSLPGTNADAILKEIDELQTHKIETPWWKKPLGNCLKCFHIWVCVVFTIYYTILFFGSSWVIFWNAILDISLYKWVLSVSISYFILVYNNYK